MHRDQDVPVTRRRQPVDDRLRHAAVEDEHRPLARAHFQPCSGELGDLSGPCAGGGDGRAARNDGLLAAALVAQADRRERTIGRMLEADEGLVASRLGAMLPRAGEVRLDELPGLERGVGHAVRGADPAVQERLFGEELVERHRLRLDARGRARGGKPLDVVVRVVWRRDEQAAGGLDGCWGDPTQDAVLLDAVSRRDRVALHVASARMEEAVVAPAGARREVAAFDEERSQAAHGEVAQHSRPGGAATDDDHVHLGGNVHPGSPRSSGNAPRR